jgi:hypothetical protein
LEPGFSQESSSSSVAVFCLREMTPNLLSGPTSARRRGGPDEKHKNGIWAGHERRFRNARDMSSPRPISSALLLRHEGPSALELQLRGPSTLAFTWIGRETDGCLPPPDPCEPRQASDTRSPAPCPRLCPNRSGAPDCALSVVASSKSRQGRAGGQAAATSAARAAILPTLCSVDYRHEHIDMVTTGAPTSSRSNDPWPSHLRICRSYRYFDLSNQDMMNLPCSRPMQRRLNRPGHHTLSLGS